MTAKETQPDAIDVLLDRGDVTLLDIVDHVLNKGVVLRADILLGLADVELVRLQLWVLLSASDRVVGDLPPFE